MHVGLYYNEKLTVKRDISQFEKISHMTDNNRLCFSTPILHPDWIFRWTNDGRKFYRNCAAAHRKAEEIIRKRRQALQENVRNITDYNPSNIFAGARLV